jgi:hypothetical protein
VSGELPVVGASDGAVSSAPVDSLERVIGLYRRQVARCRTENQLNRVHIAVENHMTPAELRYFAAALAGEPADSPSRQWITRLADGMPTKKLHPHEFVRQGQRKGMSLYTADVGSRAAKTLIIGITGRFHRLMSPMPWVLDVLNPELYDVVVLRDYSARMYAMGIPGLGRDFFDVMSSLRQRFDPRAYRNAMALGTSGGGLHAIMAALLLRLNRGIAVSPQGVRRFPSLLKEQDLRYEPFAALLASRPQPYPELIVVCAAEHRDDLEAATALHRSVPSQLWTVKNCGQHGVFKFHLARGTLPTFFARILGQSPERREAPATIATQWVLGPPGGAPPRPTTGGLPRS